jgi:hypothetical protein
MLHDYLCCMTSKSCLCTVGEVMDAFGGARAMSAIFGGVPTRFYNYKAAGRFPDSMHMRVYVEAKARGLNIAPELIGMKRPDPQRELTLQAAE